MKASTQAMNKLLQHYILAYTTNQNYITSCWSLFSVQHLSKAHSSVALQILLKILTFFLATLSTKTTPPEVATPVVSENVALPDGGNAKTGYVGGMCMTKLKYHSHKFIENYKHKKNGEDIQKHSNIVDCLTEHLHPSLSECHENTSNAANLKERERKSDVFGHLTYIDDQMFSFFQNVDKEIFKLFNVKNLAKYKQKLF